MAPLYTDTLIQDISGSLAWVDVVNRCFKVVNRLIRSPGDTGVSLRLEISSNKQAMSNLERILYQGTSLKLLDQGNEAGQDDSHLKKPLVVSLWNHLIRTSGCHKQSSTEPLA